MDSIQLKHAHGHSRNNKEEIEKSGWCGCFYCCETFPASDIDKWIKEETTALCPKCNIDSVIGDASKISLTEEFLLEMHKYWFNWAKKKDD
tara:strand:- start:779 stop:1051 length:273 start_codon:yes stop_codon:yes gene_type:complete